MTVHEARAPARRSPAPPGLWVPPVLIMVAIFVASSSPSVALPAQVSDKAVHLAAFGTLAATLLRALAGGRWQGVSGRRAVLAAVLAAIYGVSDELHQAFVPGRSAELGDLLADAAGGSIAAGVVRAWSIIRARLSA